MRNALVTWQQGDRICRSHFMSRSEERAALIMDTLDPESLPMLSRLPTPASHLLGHLLPWMLTNPHLHRLIGTTPIASTYGRLDHLWKLTTRVGGQNTTWREGRPWGYPIIRPGH